MTPEKRDHRFFDADPLDILAGRFFKEMRMGLLLGSISSETVECLFESLFPGGAEDMEALPSSIRDEITTILKIYPEVASRLGLDGSPGVLAVLERVARSFGAGARCGLRNDPPTGRAWFAPGREGLDWAVGEEQQPFGPMLPGVEENLSGESRLRADSVPWFRLRVRFDVARKRLCFSASGLECEIGLHLSGRPLLTLGPTRRRGTLALRRFLTLEADLDWDRARIEVRPVGRAIA